MELQSEIWNGIEIDVIRSTYDNNIKWHVIKANNESNVSEGPNES